ncbi:hypothetical protein GCM10025867_35800 [Frondihabitans sucicola]|uniref:Uncharacterized protein n=1 Tax=Frondihabitans sucicola TaxID=1268041 RepID=A0ABM8GSC3_9MICO|nr:hypothetical protein GCM10025867_35800 [Frondihabitans sucicola]
MLDRGDGARHRRDDPEAVPDEDRQHRGRFGDVDDGDIEQLASSSLPCSPKPAMITASNGSDQVDSRSSTDAAEMKLS